MDTDVNNRKNEHRCYSRREFLARSAALLATGVLSGVTNVFAADSTANPGSKCEAPPLPWKWVKLDPLEAGRRGYRYYLEKGGCGTGSYLSILSLLKEKVGYPWTMLPDMMMAHAATGYGSGNGTLCGALGGASCIINLATYNGKDQVFRQMVDRLFAWYAEQDFPTERFDDISTMPKQIKVKAMSPLCHTSVSKWTLAAGAQVTSKAKYERCAKVVGEVVYTVVGYLNDYADGTWTPAVWKPAKHVEHCVMCHGPNDMQPAEEGNNNNQQGRMDCLLCHQDHTKK